MEILKEREKRVLELIMDSYINSAEPIGSETIARSLQKKLSPATIRNVMSDLEELGFLYKPHVVAGRIPTYKAFRYYINTLLVLREPGKKDLQLFETLIKPRYAYVEEIMGDASRVLAAISQFTSIVVEPRIDTMLFKEIEFVKLDKRRILIVFITSSGLVHTRLVNTEDSLDMGVLNSMKRYMNEKFGGVPFYALRDGIMEDMERDKEDYRRLLEEIKRSLETIMEAESQREVYLEGTSRIIGVPEFTDLERLKELFQAFEKKELLLRLLDKCMHQEGFTVIVGTESDIKELRDMSIIASTYRVGDKGYGILGVIGPVRMNYSRIIPIVNYTAKTVTDILRMI